MRRLGIALLSLCLFTCASSTRFAIEVSGLASREIATKSYIILPGADDLRANDLQFMEVARYVRGALARRGFVETSEANAADIAVFLTYGIGDPKTRHYTRIVPVYGEIGGGTSTVSLSTYGADGVTTTHGTVTTSSTRGQIGTNVSTDVVTTYFRYLVLDAWDLNQFRKSHETVPVWKTVLTSTGSSGDLRRVLPVMVAAGEPYVGTNTGKQLHINLGESDSRVTLVRSAQ